jgi:F420 biosynthesis protein FbiB-like protein
MSMDARQLLLTRRSVRRFLPDPLPRSLLLDLLETAAWAPSAHHRQPWRFVVVEQPEDRLRLVEAMHVPFRADLQADGLPAAEIDQRLARSRQMITSAAAAVLLCLDPGDLAAYPDPRRQSLETQMGVQSVALAGGTLLLAAHAAGLGGLWMGAPLYAPQAVRDALGLPPAWQPQGLILLGYPAETPAPRLRRPLDEVVRFAAPQARP